MVSVSVSNKNSFLHVWAVLEQSRGCHLLKKVLYIVTEHTAIGAMGMQYQKKEKKINELFNRSEQWLH